MRAWRPRGRARRRCWRPRRLPRSWQNRARDPPAGHGSAGVRRGVPRALPPGSSSSLLSTRGRCAPSRAMRQAGLMAETLTLMAVHAHPDDEASSTGGVLALYGDQGVRTIVVTCTNGEFGDGPGGVKPGTDGHDEEAVAQTRLAELRKSAKILGLTELETL